jgi:hypothetical protein
MLVLPCGDKNCASWHRGHRLAYRIPHYHLIHIPYRPEMGTIDIWVWDHKGMKNKLYSCLSVWYTSNKHIRNKERIVRDLFWVLSLSENEVFCQSELAGCLTDLLVRFLPKWFIFVLIPIFVDFAEELLLVCSLSTWFSESWMFSTNWDDPSPKRTKTPMISTFLPNTMLEVQHDCSSVDISRFRIQGIKDVDFHGNCKSGPTTTTLMTYTQHTHRRWHTHHRRRNTGTATTGDTHISTAPQHWHSHYRRHTHIHLAPQQHLAHHHLPVPYSSPPTLHCWCGASILRPPLDATFPNHMLHLMRPTLLTRSIFF